MTLGLTNNQNKLQNETANLRSGDRLDWTIASPILL